MIPFDIIKSRIYEYHKIIIELGIGDGQLLNILANKENENNILFIGIEKDFKQFNLALQLISKKNVCLVNDSFERILPEFPDASIDKIICVLPDPRYIDKFFQKNWESFYGTIPRRLKKNGVFVLVTELTDDLLEPVTEIHFMSWIEWLTSIFISIGFRIQNIIFGIPAGYSSRLLDQFVGDPLRIKIVTLELTKNSFYQ